MRKQVATLLMCLFGSHLHGTSLELNLSYDYFRGLPDGSWNGNNGAFISANFGTCLFDMIGIQAGGSYGLYNWDGRANIVFNNPKKIQEQAFVTAGFSSSFSNVNIGIVYDRMFTNHFGIYDVSPSIDQLRFQAGYVFNCDEFGYWGTLDLTRSHKLALGIPVVFKAIGQMNLFWTHFFDNCAKTTLWAGIPYRDSLMFPRGKAGNFTAGISFKAPLTESLFVEGHGAYMKARTAHGSIQSRNYAANICLGITYLFTNECRCYEDAYMSLANNSNFFVDTNLNQ